MVIELIGGVGAGKSRILQILSDEYGAVRVEADRVAAGLERKGLAGYRRLVGALGDGILGSDGELDRRKLAEMIFSDHNLLKLVNGIIHPLVWEEIHRLAEDFRRETAAAAERPAGDVTSVGDESRGGEGTSVPPLLVVETAIPDEKPGDIYDEVWYVYTLRETRIQRLMEGRGYSRGKCLSIMENQHTEETYRAMADRVIDNNGDPDAVRLQIEEILG